MHEDHVHEAFDIHFLLSCQRNQNKWLPVPAGNSRPQATDTLPAELAHIHNKYVQSEDEDFCVPYAMANALHHAGFVADAAFIASNAGYIACTDGDPISTLQYKMSTSPSKLSSSTEPASTVAARYPYA